MISPTQLVARHASCFLPLEERSAGWRATLLAFSQQSRSQVLGTGWVVGWIYGNGALALIMSSPSTRAALFNGR